MDRTGGCWTSAGEEKDASSHLPRPGQNAFLPAIGNTHILLVSDRTANNPTDKFFTFSWCKLLPGVTPSGVCVMCLAPSGADVCPYGPFSSSQSLRAHLHVCDQSARVFNERYE